MVCERCGAKLAEGTKFCYKCGSRVGNGLAAVDVDAVEGNIKKEERPAAVPAAPAAPVQNTFTENKKADSKLFIAAGAVCVILLICAGIFIFSRMNKTVELKIHAMDSETGEDLEGVLFEAQNTRSGSITAVTDAEGNAVIEEFPSPGRSVSYSVSKDFYIQDDITVNKKSGKDSIEIVAGLVRDKSITRTYTVNVQAANMNAPAADAEVSLYAPDSEEPAYTVKTDGSGRAFFEDIDNGDYKAVCRTDGYTTETWQVKIEDGTSSEYDCIMVPETTDAGCAYVLLTWKGAQDLDLCVADNLNRDFLMASNNPSRSGSFIHSDNDSSTGYELVMIYGVASGAVDSIFVVDTEAAKNRQSSTMEADGVTVKVYGTDPETGEKKAFYSQDALAEKTSPVWSPCYIYLGKAYESDHPYIDNLEGQEWVDGIK